MKEKELIEKSDIIRKKYDILLLSEFLNLYDEYCESNNIEHISPEVIFREIQYSINYSEKEIKEIIEKAKLIGKN